MAIAFQYYELTPEKQQALKHDGHVYRVTPYDMIWNSDRYYVIGFSEKHGKVAVFRVNRLVHLTLTDEAGIERPEDYSAERYENQVVQMYDSAVQRVVLRCKNHLMGVVVDRFGMDCETECLDEAHFVVTAKVAVSPTFFAWVFTFVGEMEIVSPVEVKAAWDERLRLAFGET